MQSDFAKSDGIKIWFENPMAHVVRFWPKSDGLDPSDYQTEQSRPGTAAVGGNTQMYE